MFDNNEVYGYLPEERPETGKLILYALQQVIVMFPATIAVALITGFQVSTTLFASGLATLCFILITGKRIPLYYGSSFAYLAAVMGLAASEATAEQAAQAREIIKTVGEEKAASLPEQMVENIANGRVQKFFKEQTLEEQDFVWDNKISVAQYIQAADKEAKVVAFKRFSLSD